MDDGGNAIWSACIWHKTYNTNKNLPTVFARENIYPRFREYITTDTVWEIFLFGQNDFEKVLNRIDFLHVFHLFCQVLICYNKKLSYVKMIIFIIKTKQNDNNN